MKMNTTCVITFVLLFSVFTSGTSSGSSSSSFPAMFVNGGSSSTKEQEQEQEQMSSSILTIHDHDPRLRFPHSRSIRPVDIKNIHAIPELLDVRTKLHSALAKFQAENGFGRAIAAPQIGHNVQMIAMRLSELEPPVTLYNPEIIEKSPEQLSLWDDCFSLPDIMVRVSRHKSITVKFIADGGEERVWRCDDIALSELLQHEIDHLSGILAVDNALPPITECQTVLCESIIKRKEYEKYKDIYNCFVDYAPSV